MLKQILAGLARRPVSQRRATHFQSDSQPPKTMAMQPSIYRMQVRLHLHASEYNVLLKIIFNRV